MNEFLPRKAQAEPLAETPSDDLAGGAALCASGLFLPVSCHISFIQFSKHPMVSCQDV